MRTGDDQQLDTVQTKHLGGTNGYLRPARQFRRPEEVGRGAWHRTHRDYGHERHALVSEDGSPTSEQ